MSNENGEIYKDDLKQNHKRQTQSIVQIKVPETNTTSTHETKQQTAEKFQKRNKSIQIKPKLRKSVDLTALYTKNISSTTSFKNHNIMKYIKNSFHRLPSSLDKSSPNNLNQIRENNIKYKIKNTNSEKTQQHNHTKVIPSKIETNLTSKELEKIKKRPGDLFLNFFL